MKRLGLLFLCLLLCLNGLTRVTAADLSVVYLYVSPKGSDQNFGSEQFPFATLQKAVKTVRLLEERTVVVLREGTYEGGLSLDQRDRSVTYRAYPGERVVIRAQEGEHALSLDGCGEVAVQGITFVGGSGGALKHCVKALVADCTFSEMEQGLSIEGNARIESNIIEQIAGSGIVASGGDRSTLKKADCVIVNNLIREYAQNKKNDPGVLLSGVGITLSNNEISDGAACALEIRGNDHLVQYNLFQRITALGVISTEGNVTARGTRVQYNNIRDCKGSGILLGEFSSGITIFSNIFYRLNEAAKILGGRNNFFQNNLSVDCGTSLSLEAQALPEERRKEIQKQLDEVVDENGVWLKRYPELATLMKDRPQTPKYNQITGNKVYQTLPGDIDSAAKKSGRLGADTVLADASVFMDYKAGDVTLREGMEFAKQIGTRMEQTKAVLSQSIILQTGSFWALAHGQGTQIDANNAKVTPMVQAGRTLVPIRFVAEQMGAKVDWNQTNQQVTVTKGGTVLSLTLNSPVIMVNGIAKTIDVPAIKEYQRTFIPLRVVAETLQMKVVWDPSGLIVISQEEVNLTDELLKKAIVRRVVMVPDDFDES